MNFDLTDEQQMLRDAARRFADEHYAFDIRRRVISGTDGFSRDRWKDFAELGWLSLGLPEDVGGLGCSFVETVLLMEEFGRVLATEPYATTAVLCARIIDRSKSVEYRSTLLTALGEGRLLAALAHDEEGDRFARDAAATSAAAVDDGYLLNGTKMLVLDAPSAEYLIVSAKTGDGIGLFLVPRSANGVSLSNYTLIDATRAADVTFASVRLSKSALLVGTNDAQEVLNEALDRIVLAYVAEALGAMQAVLEVTSAYLKQRVQFDQPIGRFQALQHRMAEMFVEVQETRSILYQGLAALDFEPAQRSRAIAAAKVIAGNAAKFVGTQGIQLHGGIGMTDEYSVGHYYKKLVAFEKRFGDTDFYIDRYLTDQPAT